MKVTLSLLSRNEFRMNPEEKRFNLDKCPFLRKKYGESDVGYLLLISPNANPPGVIVDGSQKTVKNNFPLFWFEFEFYFKKRKLGKWDKQAEVLRKHLRWCENQTKTADEKKWEGKSNFYFKYIFLIAWK